MRQIALIVLLAQAGSFVPAASATIGPVDRVFTRVGASDDIAGGRSTFMIEMLEVAEIIDSATANSLVLLDEVGRGTSTTDGLAIAQALTEHLHDEVGSFTIFATHHHELTETADELDRAMNLHFDATSHDGEITFDHKIGRGPATASYGVEVAREAGVSEEVVERARELLADSADAEPTEPTFAAAPGKDVSISDKSQDAPAEDSTGPAVTSGGTALDEDTAAALAALRETDVATLTPIEALNRLAEIKERLE